MKKMLMTLAAVFFAVSLLADTWPDPDTGITWTYTIVGDEAQIGTGGSAAISTATSGYVDVPAELGGKPVTAIGGNAFKGCIGLSYINIPDPVASIGESAFEGCTGLSGIDLSASVTSIHKYAFDDCSGLTWIYVDPKNANYKSVNGMLLTKDGTTLVQGINGGVTIPDGVTTIGDSAFSGCGGLWSVTIPASVTTIDQFAFWRCVGLASVTIPDGVTTINSGAFRYCNSLKRLMISQAGVDNFGAFNGYYTDLKVVIADGVTSIPDNAFKNCTGIKSVLIPGSVTTIGESAFEGCTGLDCLSICSGVTTIKKNAFKGCIKLDYVTIPKGVSTIGEDAFGNCTALSHAHLPYTGPFGDVALVNGIFSGSTPAKYSSIKRENVDVEAVGDVGLTYSGSTYASVGCFITGGTYLWAIPKTATGDLIIPSTLGGKPVTRIRETAFKGCAGLTKVTVPSSVTTIASDAFDDCTLLVYALIPASFESSPPTFSGCGSVSIFAKDVTVTRVDGILWTYAVDGSGNAILGCGDGYYDRAPAIPENTSGALTIPASIDGHPVTTIGTAAFQGRSDITRVTIPSSVTSISENAFFACTGLQEIVVPQSVTVCGDNAFAYCSHMYEAVMPVVFEPNEYSIFNPSPTSVSYRDVDLEIADGRAWVYTVDDGKATVGGGVNGQALTPAYVTTVGDIAIPSLLGGYPVTSIGEEAFYNCDGLTGVDIPSSVAVIGDEAFYDCDGLTGVDIPSSVAAIGDEAFAYCDGLTGVDIPSSVAAIGDEAFAYCDGLASVTIVGNGATTIGDEAFYDCDSLTSVMIGNGVATIGDSAFEDCSALESVTIIGNGAMTIGDCAFEYCDGLTSVTIGNGVATIGANAFSSCPGLTSVTIPEGVTSVDDSAFADCAGLATVAISSTVTSIHPYAFDYCTGLTAFSVAAGNAVYSSVSGLLLSKDGKTLIKGVKGNVTIPDGVETIGDSAFWGSGLTSAKIPASVTFFDKYAFGGCDLLTEVAIPPSVTTIGESAFKSSPLKTVHVGVGDTDRVKGLIEGSGYSTAGITFVEDVPPIYTVTFNANGGLTGEATRPVYYGAVVGELPVPTREEYTFKGWFTAVEGGDQVTAATVVTADVTFFAQWKKNAVDPESLDPFDPGTLPCYEVLNPADIWNPIKAPKATTLMGAAYYGCDVVAIVELKVGKPSRDMYAKVSGSVMLLDGKKYTIKSQKCYFGGEFATTLNLEVKGGGNLRIAIGSIGGVNVFSGELGKWHVQTAKVGGDMKNPTATVKVDMSDVLDSLPSGMLSQLLPTNEVAEVSGGKWKFKKAAGVKYTKPKAGQSTLTPIDAAGKGLVVDTSKDKTNLSGLKLTYTLKKGTFKGSFKMFELKGGKLSKYTVNVNGVVVDGVGYGTATCKKPAFSCPVVVE